MPITSDKGLCGGVNSAIVREVKKTIINNRDMYKVIVYYKIMVIGGKGASGLLRPCPDLLVTGISEVASPVNFS